MSLKELSARKQGKEDSRNAAVLRWSMSMDALHSLETTANEVIAERIESLAGVADQQGSTPAEPVVDCSSSRQVRSALAERMESSAIGSDLQLDLLHRAPPQGDKSRCGTGALART